MAAKQINPNKIGLIKDGAIHFAWSRCRVRLNRRSNRDLSALPTAYTPKQQRLGSTKASFQIKLPELSTSTSPRHDRFDRVCPAPALSASKKLLCGAVWPNVNLRRCRTRPSGANIFRVQAATGAKSPISVTRAGTAGAHKQDASTNVNGAYSLLKGHTAIALLAVGTKSNLSLPKAGLRHKSLDMRNRVATRFRASEIAVPVWR